MASNILVAMDDSEMAERALEYALETHPDADITVLHVVGEPSSMMGKAMGIALEDDLETAAEVQAEPVFERARRVADAHDRTITTTLALGTPAKAIIERAGEFESVVIGSHGGSLRDRLFVGNVAQKVFRHAPVPVTAVR